MISVDQIRKLRRGEVAIIGAPLDENSSFLRGADLAPGTIREALHEGSSNMSTELGVDLAAIGGWHDLGNLRLTSGEAAFNEIEGAVSLILAKGAKPLVLGGDHSITYASAKACAKEFHALSVLDFDAHPDLYDEYEGSRWSHACPFARLMEEKLDVRLVQIGIRASNPHQTEQAKRFGVRTYDMRHWPPARMPKFGKKLYVSIDLDGLDPAFAPGVSHHEPGGLSVRDVLGVLHGLESEIIGADIVELNPKRDLNGVTARVASKFYKELVGLMMRQRLPSHPRKH